MLRFLVGAKARGDFLACAESRGTTSAVRITSRAQECEQLDSLKDEPRQVLENEWNILGDFEGGLNQKLLRIKNRSSKHDVRDFDAGEIRGPTSKKALVDESGTEARCNFNRSSIASPKITLGGVSKKERINSSGVVCMDRCIRESEPPPAKTDVVPSACPSACAQNGFLMLLSISRQAQRPNAKLGLRSGLSNAPTDSEQADRTNQLSENGSPDKETHDEVRTHSDRGPAEHDNNLLDLSDKELVLTPPRVRNLPAPCATTPVELPRWPTRASASKGRLPRVVGKQISCGSARVVSEKIPDAAVESRDLNALDVQRSLTVESSTFADASVPQRLSTHGKGNAIESIEHNTRVVQSATDTKSASDNCERCCVVPGIVREGYAAQAEVTKRRREFALKILRGRGGPKHVRRSWQNCGKTSARSDNSNLIFGMASSPIYPSRSGLLKRKARCGYGNGDAAGTSSAVGGFERDAVRPRLLVGLPSPSLLRLAAQLEQRSSSSTARAAHPGVKSCGTRN